MTPLPPTDEMKAVACRIIWFEEPETALSDPIRLLAYAFEGASFADIQVLRRYLKPDDWLEALSKAPPGIIGPRSWAYWNAVVGRDPAPPLPQRMVPNIG